MHREARFKVERSRRIVKPVKKIYIMMLIKHLFMSILTVSVCAVLKILCLDTLYQNSNHKVISLLRWRQLYKL